MRSLNLPITLFAILIHATGYAEVVFEKQNVRIQGVNCETNELTLKDMFNTQMKIRKDYDKERFGDLCEKLFRYSGSNPGAALTGHNRAVTLLTVASETHGDLIRKQEVVGVYDGDTATSVIAPELQDPIATEYCGILNNGTRSSPKACLFVSKAGLHFLELKSSHSFHFSKASLVSSKDNQIVLESKNLEGQVEVTTSVSLNEDKTSAQVNVSFGGNASSSGLLQKVN